MKNHRIQYWVLVSDDNPTYNVRFKLKREAVNFYQNEVNEAVRSFEERTGRTVKDEDLPRVRELTNYEEPHKEVFTWYGGAFELLDWVAGAGGLGEYAKESTQEEWEGRWFNK